MNQDAVPGSSADIREGQDIDDSLRLAFARTVLLHRRLALPLVVWRDGQVAEIPADQLVLDPAIEVLARR